MKKKIIIGVDGGGTKTESWVVDLDGNILGKGLSGSANPRNSSIKDAAFSVNEAIKRSLGKTKQREIVSLCIGLAAIEEEYKSKKKEFLRELFKLNRELAKKRDKIILESDQKIAFASGSKEKEGIVVIAGTGSVARGWKKKRDVKAGGWGWLADEGSASSVGQKAYQITLKKMDGRIKESKIADHLIKEFKIKDIDDLNRRVYQSNTARELALFSLVVDFVANKKDKEAKKIMQEAAREIVKSVETVARELNFKKEFPLVVVGGMFKSGTLRNLFKREIKKRIPQAKILIVVTSPVYGAIRLAMKNIK